MKLRKRIAELLEQERDDDQQARLLNILLMLLILLNVIAIFLETVDPVYEQYRSYFWYFEVFSVAIFTIEYLARVWSSIELDSSGHTRPIAGRIRYMLRPIALVDLLAILPFYLSFYVAMDLRFMRVLRLLRLLKLARYSPALGALLDVLHKESEALLASLVVLLMMLVISAGGIYVLESDIQPETFGSMPDSLWWAIVTLTTVGYGDVVPATTLGRMFAGLIGLIGIGMIALPAAIMASGFVENIQGRKQQYNRTIRKFLQDGVITEEESQRLEKLRTELALDSDEAMHLLQEIVEQASPDKCPQCGIKLR